MVIHIDVDRKEFEEKGLCELPAQFLHAEVNAMLSEIERVISLSPPGLVKESNSDAPRGLQGPHLLSPLLMRLTRDRRLLSVADYLLGGPVYLHQFKVNFKMAFVGEAWPWHQDFAYWHKLDGIPEPHLVTAMVALDPVSAFNGPLFFIPGSHLQGLIEDDVVKTEPPSEDVTRSFSSDLPLQVSKAKIEAMLAGSEIVAPSMSTGSVIFFAANLAHASMPNVTPYPRRVVLITYNRIDNTPTDVLQPRPEYIAGKSFLPLQQIGEFAGATDV
jgi:ectoine hydroxylase-related dioxygenase (phytanoyl-CoA dioxygenase family)